MLLWAASEGERFIWVQAFKESMIPTHPNLEKTKPPKQLVTEKNEFIVTLYKCLIPIFGPDGKALPV